jgi:hypothetical protein
MYRYGISRTWDTSRPRWLYIMVNPPLEGSQYERRLTLQLQKLTATNGGGAYYLAHLYCYAADDVEAVWPLSEPDRIGPLGGSALAQFVTEARGRHGAIVAAWGDHPRAFPRANAVAKRLRESGPVKCFGQVKPGVPTHPLHVPGGARLEAF